ncbi:MAG: hypothetical protein FJ279_19000 [Planctomycetes bacterium]|nr:hypothetical protein [Planctomycetota bacterium]
MPRCPGPKGLGAEYFYRSSAPDDRNAVVCWDRAPHEIRHTIFWFRNKTLRNTLRANGMVETVTEAEFRGLGLSE